MHVSKFFFCVFKSSSLGIVCYLKYIQGLNGLRFDFNKSWIPTLLFDVNLYLGISNKSVSSALKNLFSTIIVIRPRETEDRMNYCCGPGIRSILDRWITMGPVVRYQPTYGA